MLPIFEENGNFYHADELSHSHFTTSLSSTLQHQAPFFLLFLPQPIYFCLDVQLLLLQTLLTNLSLWVPNTDLGLPLVLAGSLISVNASLAKGDNIFGGWVSELRVSQNTERVQGDRTCPGGGGAGGAGTAWDNLFSRSGSWHFLFGTLSPFLNILQNHCWVTQWVFLLSFFHILIKGKLG